MAPEEIFSQLSMVSKLRIFVFNLTPFNSNLSYFYQCESGPVFGIRIPIQKVDE